MTDRAPRPEGKYRQIVESSETALATLRDAAEMLWVVLANVSGGNWKEQSADWQAAAARWRDNYFAAIGHPPAKGDVTASAPKEPTP